MSDGTYYRGFDSDSSGGQRVAEGDGRLEVFPQGEDFVAQL
jgi:hypothetical protein